MRRSLTLLLVFFPVIFVAQVQKMDSLEQVLKQTSRQTERYKLLNELAPLLINFEKPEKAEVFLKELKDLAHQNGDFKNEAKAYRALSMIYQNKSDYQTAIKQIQKAIKIDDSIHCLKCYLLDVNQLGRIYIDMQQPEKAINIYQTGIQKSDKTSDPKILRIQALIYGNLGIAYGKMYQKKKQIQAFLKQAELAEKAGSFEQKSKAFYNIGYLYMDMEQYPKAESYFYKAMEDSIQIKNKDYVYMNYHSLGLLYSRWHKFDKALHYDSLALNTYKKNGYKLYVFDVLNNIAVVYQRMKQYDKAIPYHQKALKLADSLNHKLIQIGGKLSFVNTLLHLKKYNKAEKILKQLVKDTIDRHNFNLSNLADFWEYNYEVYKHQKQYQKALAAFEKYKTINDSISNKERDIKIADLETKYQSEAKEKKLIEKEKELLKQKVAKQNLIIGLGISGLLLIFLLFFLIKFYRKHQKEKRKLVILTRKVKALTEQLTKEEKIAFNQSGISQVSNYYNNKSKKAGILPSFDNDKNRFESQVIKDFHNYLKNKFGIDRPILIEVWASIANGVSRKEFTEKFGYSENTVKAWRKDLYKILKQFDISGERYTDYKAAGLYYQYLIEYLDRNYFFRKNIK